jgi:hypothetical protein
MLPTVLANAGPFCSKLTRSAFGVFPLKNFSQLALIVAVVALELPAPVPELGPGAAELVAADGLGGGELGPELLEQADIAAASTKPSAGAARTRRTSKWNRIRYASLDPGTDYHVSQVSNH